MARLEQEWQSLLQAIDEVPDDRLLEPGVISAWSVRDLLSHISTWENEFPKAMAAILAGQRLPHYSTLYGGIKAFNAQEQERARALSLTELRQSLTETHGRLLATFAGLPALAPKVEERMRRR